MPITKEILSMFEFSQNPKIALSVDNHSDEYALSQERSVPTDRQTLSMHQYLPIVSHRRASIVLWVHPLMVFSSDCAPNLLTLYECMSQDSLSCCKVTTPLLHSSYPIMWVGGWAFGPP